MARQEERTAAARSRLLEAAREVFVERGFGESSLGEVATRAGVSRGLVYHHFGSKDALLLALHEQLDQDLLAQVQAAVGDYRPLENLVRGATAFLKVAAQPVARITLLETPAVPGLRQHAEEGQRHWAGLIETELRRGVELGDISPIDTAMAARVLVGAMQEAALAVIADRSPKAASRRAQEAIERLIMGLASR